MVSSRAGQSEADIVVFVGALAVHADAAQRFGKLGIIGEDRAAIADSSRAAWRERSWSRWQGRRCRAGGPCSSRQSPARRHRARTGPRPRRRRRSRHGRRSARTDRPGSPPSA